MFISVVKKSVLVLLLLVCSFAAFTAGANDLCDSGRVVLVSCDVDEASCMMKYPRFAIGFKPGLDFPEAFFI